MSNIYDWKPFIQNSGEIYYSLSWAAPPWVPPSEFSWLSQISCPWLSWCSRFSDPDCCWVRTLLWRSATLWNYWMISRLAWMSWSWGVGLQLLLELIHNGEEGQKSGLPLCQRCSSFWILQLTWFEVVPARDVVEGSLLNQGGGIEGEHQLHRVIMSGHGKSV